MNPILITGCARSGTSMSAGIINMNGAFGGTMSGPNRSNQKGMFENATIRNAIVKPWLQSHGYDPMCQTPLPDVTNLPPWPALKHSVDEVFRLQGYQKGPWFYKGAKMCLMWPRWHEAYPGAKWIIVRREDSAIVNSCLKTGFMRKRSTVESWQEWINYHKMCFQQMHSAELQVREVWPSKFVEGDYTEIREVVEWAGLTFDEAAARKFISPELYGG